MARKRSYKTPPKLQSNQWVRDAIDHAEANGVRVTFELIADELTRAKIGQSYDKSMVQKMTTTRMVKADEMRVIASFTGYPIEHRSSDTLEAKVDRLPEKDREIISQMVDRLLAAAEAGQRAD